MGWSGVWWMVGTWVGLDGRLMRNLLGGGAPMKGYELLLLLMAEKLLLCSSVVVRSKRVGGKFGTLH